MPFDFPDSPAIDDSVTAPGGPTFTWDGAKWMAGAGSSTAYMPLAGDSTKDGALTVTGALTVNADLSVGKSTSATGVGIEIGDDRTVDGVAYLDFHTAAGGADYDFRIFCEGGADGNTSIIANGDGRITLAASSTAMVHTTCSLVVGNAAAASDAALYIGRTRNLDGNALIDLQATAGAAGNYDLRLIREQGINGNSSIQSNGTGTFSVLTDGMSRVTIGAQPNSVSFTSSQGLAAMGIICRPGTPGPAGNNMFNIDWAPGANLWIDGINQGLITTTSDYRVKENIADLPPMWNKVKALHPISYTLKDNEELRFMANPLEQWGFIAHELQETLTESVATGQKDAPNLVQSPNVLAVLAPVVSALQEAMTRIESLEAALQAQP